MLFDPVSTSTGTAPPAKVLGTITLMRAVGSTFHFAAYNALVLLP